MSFSPIFPMKSRNPFLDLFTISEEAPPESSFLHQSREAVERHFQRGKYGNFLLPEGIRPSFDLQVIPTEGFRTESYTDELLKKPYPSLYAAISGQRLMEVLFALLEPLGPTLCVTLESTHDDQDDDEKLFFRDEIDAPVFKSILLDFEQYLLSDGCASITAAHPEALMEIRLDDHKLLVAYADDLREFEQILIHNSIYPLPGFKLITDGEHVHVTRNSDLDSFHALLNVLNAEPC